ncbi:hypothetical protein [Gordonia mangrovi]|uniref:hypothetical protein n=1 Tax=Gordonia mangrovi TaxID=2665643 RepID=UPI00192869C4|nr:hypothetical protein [Gordonia mangrovi]UVF80942.1 hypothetical protein NWF22_16015 [Gordonia mangrovi]
MSGTADAGAALLSPLSELSLHALRMSADVAINEATATPERLNFTGFLQHQIMAHRNHGITRSQETLGFAGGQSAPRE